MQNNEKQQNYNTNNDSEVLELLAKLVLNEYKKRTVEKKDKINEGDEDQNG